MTVRRIVPDLYAADPIASAAFHRALLGLDVVMDHGWAMTLAAPGAPAAQLTLVRQDAGAPCRPDVSVEVDDVLAVHANALRLGCDVVHPLTDEPWGVRRFFVREPGGAVLNVLQHR